MISTNSNLGACPRRMSSASSGNGVEVLAGTCPGFSRMFEAVPVVLAYLEHGVDSECLV